MLENSKNEVNGPPWPTGLFVERSTRTVRKGWFLKVADPLLMAGEVLTDAGLLGRCPQRALGRRISRPPVTRDQRRTVYWTAPAAHSWQEIPM